MEKQTYVSYFSPTGGTKRAALMLGAALPGASPAVEIDLSAPQLPRQCFTPDDVVIFAMPVFGGRLPALAVQKLAAMQGSGTKAIALVAYGNRAYEDALLELSEALTKQGFIVVAAAAVLAEHSMLRTVAAGRPNADDQQQLSDFAHRVAAKLQTDPTALTAIPGNHPYKEWQQMPVTPVASAACNGCGICAATCPSQAIPKDHPQTTDAAKCILCLRCTVICPQQARALPAQAQAALAQKLGALQGIHKENEFFI